jgi:GNAT superfamily N-acetyltransferase
MSDALQVRPLSRSPADVTRFLKVAYGIYNGDPHWVAPLLFDARKLFSDTNPLFDHAEMQLWVAARNGRDVGRIAGIHDRTYQEVQKDGAVFFGFFECENDPATSRALFAAAADWARQRGAQQLLGPMNPTANDECGLLVEGFDSPPQFMMGYNPPYYEALILRDGFVRAKNLFAFHIDVAHCPLERLQRIAETTRRRNPDIRFQMVRRRTLAGDLDKIKDIYNSAWQRNWGFTPMTAAEIDFMAERLKPLLREGLVWIAEKPGEPIGFMLAVPDYNLVLQPLRGTVWTPRLFAALPYLLGRKVPPRARVVTLGVKEAYRNRGLEAVMLAEALVTGRRLGITEAEASWVLEDNLPMRRLLRPFGGRIYKTYRLYRRLL